MGKMISVQEDSGRFAMPSSGVLAVIGTGLENVYMGTSRVGYLATR